MKKLVLVPEPRFRALVESEMKNTSAGVIDAVINPEREEMVKKFQMGQEILNDDSKTDELKMKSYDNVMQSFVTQRDKVKAKLTPNPRSTPLNSITTPIDTDAAVMMRQKTVEALPINLQTTAQKLLERVKAYGDKRVIDLSSDGKVSVMGEKLDVGSGDISELVSDILRAPSAKRADNPNRRAFLNALLKMDVPEAWIKNKTARAEYQFLKRDKAIKDDKKEYSIIPKGIPDRLLSSEVLNTTDQRKTVTQSKKRANRLGPSKTSKTDIEWVDTK